MHQTLTLLMLLVAIVSVAATNSSSSSTHPASKSVWHTTADGEIILRPFAHAPYPHQSRADGWKYNDKTFPRDPNYIDSTVGIVIPPGYKPGPTVDYIVHFHGWSNHVSKVISQYKLAEQLHAANLNAILLVPQGPRDAQDSGGGKLELDPGAFAKLIDEVTTYLYKEGKIHTTRIGKIALTTHSGGYKVTAGILHLGGMNDHITDVLLLDSSYGSLDYFVDWAQADPTHRLVSLFTDHLAKTNGEFKDLLEKAGVKTRTLDEATVTDANFHHPGVTFMHIKGPHDEVPNQYFGRLIKTSALAKE